jgi:hypothetical protein
MEDRHGKTQQWAKFTGILSAREIGVAERTFLQMMDWDLSVSVDYFCCPATTNFVASLSHEVQPASFPTL